MSSAFSSVRIRWAGLAFVLAFSAVAGCGDGGGSGGGATASSGLVKALPQDLAFMARIRPAALLASPALAKLDVPALLKSQGPDMELPVPLEQIAEILLGGPEKGDPTVLITLASPVNAEELVAKTKGKKHGEPFQGKTIYSLGHFEVAFLSPTEAVVADSLPDLKKALERQAGTQAPVAMVGEFAKVDAPLAYMVKNMPFPNDPEKSKILQGVLTVKAGDSLVASVDAQMEKPEQAEKLAEMVKAQVGDAKKQLGEQLKGLLELPEPPAIGALDNLKVAAEGATLKIQAEVAAADLDLAKKAIDKFMEQMKKMEEMMKERMKERMKEAP